MVVVVEAGVTFGGSKRAPWLGLVWLGTDRCFGHFVAEKGTNARRCAVRSAAFSSSGEEKKGLLMPPPPSSPYAPILIPPPFPPSLLQFPKKLPCSSPSSRCLKLSPTFTIVKAFKCLSSLTLSSYHPPSPYLVLFFLS